jgi:hypothetical protein
LQCRLENILGDGVWIGFDGIPCELRTVFSVNNVPEMSGVTGHAFLLRENGCLFEVDADAPAASLPSGGSGDVRFFGGDTQSWETIVANGGALEVPGWSRVVLV